MPSKKIFLSPDLMRVNAGSTRRKKDSSAKTLKPRKTAVSSDKLRKKLQQRIRGFQERAGRRASQAGRPKVQKPLEVDTGEPPSAFNESLSFLQGLSASSKSKPSQPKSAPTLASGGINKAAAAADPPYGVLKNGTKPTYREWKRRTQKASFQAPPPPLVVATPPDMPPLSTTPAPAPAPTAALAVAPPSISAAPAAPSARQTALARIQKEREGARAVAQRKARRAIRKQTLGKRGGRVSVYVPNARTRHARRAEHQRLRTRSIAEVKNYLVERNLVKTGTLAPNDVLRQMYEHAILTGKVTNLDADPMMHNFKESSKGT